MSAVLSSSASASSSSGIAANVHVSTHPLISHKMTLLRDVNTPAHEFRRILKEVTFFLGYDATAGIKTRVHQVTTPMEMTFDGVKVDDSIAVIPVRKYGILSYDFGIPTGHVV